MARLILPGYLYWRTGPEHVASKLYWSRYEGQISILEVSDDTNITDTYLCTEKWRLSITGNFLNRPRELCSDNGLCLVTDIHSWVYKSRSTEYCVFSIDPPYPVVTYIQTGNRKEYENH